MKKLIIFLFLMFITYCFADAHSYPGLYDILFVKNYAEGESLGGAYTSIFGRSGSLFYNPAGLGDVREISFGLGHFQGFADSSIELLNGIMPFPSVTIGLGINYLHCPSEQIFDAEGALLANSKNSDLLVIGAFGKRVSERILLGTAVKFLYKTQNYFNVAYGIFDIGGIYEITKNLSYGISIKDLNAIANINMGANYKIIKPLFLAFDFSYYVFGKSYEKFGIEYNVYERFYIRGGYKMGDDTESLTGGLGVNIPLSKMKIKVDYSFVPNLDNSLGGRHILNLEIIPFAAASALVDKEEPLKENVSSDTNTMKMPLRERVGDTNTVEMKPEEGAQE